MLAQKLEEKKERGDQIPFYMTTLSKYDEETSSYILDLEHKWVSNIYKKDLESLGAKILDSKLGGQIGALEKSGWYFKITSEQYEEITKQWKKDRLKDFGEKLASGHFDKKRAWKKLRDDISNNFGLVSKSKVFDMMDSLEETDDMKLFKEKISNYRAMNIECKTLLEMMDQIKA